MHLEYLFRTVITLYDNIHIITLTEILYTANLHMASPKTGRMLIIYSKCYVLIRLTMNVTTFVSL